MVHYWFNNKNGVIDKYADVIIDELRQMLESIVKHKIYVKLGIVPTNESLAFKKILLNEMSGTKTLIAPDVSLFCLGGRFMTQYGDFQQKIHLEIGGINGDNTISIRKMTYLDEATHGEIVGKSDTILLKYQKLCE